MPDECLHLLNVDDKPEDILLFQRAVERSGLPIKLFVASSGEQASRFLEFGSDSPLRKAPDFIVLDVRMPGMNGLQLLETIRRRNECKRSSVIMLTVSDKDQDRDSARKLGASGYFLKSLNYPEPTEFVKDLYGHWVRGEVPDYWQKGS
jgi:CheY-like chemotaxis protein